jgi:hypothetical protein
MSEQEGTKEHIDLIRNTLLTSVFQHYHAFVNCLKQLPILQQLPLLQKAYMDIDTGIILVKEILMTSPLLFPPKEEKKEIIAEEKIAEENN